MKVCYVNAFYDPDISSGTEFLERIFTVREFAREQARLGSEVHVLQLFHRDETLERDQVSYQFIRPAGIYAIAGRLISSLRRSTPPAHYQLGTRLTDQLRRIRPDVIHFFGLSLDLNLWLVSRAANRLGIPLVVHYNGGRPPAGRFRRAVQRGNLRRVERFLFTTTEHARPWIDIRMPLDPERVVPFMETSSALKRQPRQEARRKTGMTGEPVFLWTGRLHPEKDPMTALRAFERILDHWPDAQYYLYYLSAELLPEMHRYLELRPQLSEHVHFHGRAAYEDMASIYSSADFLMQASLREVAGLAVLEAMSCGAIPVVTDLPSFKAMTGEGAVGVLFPQGDDGALARQILTIDRGEIPCLSHCVHQHFQQHLSFPTLARWLHSLYREISDPASTPPPPSG